MDDEYYQITSQIDAREILRYLNDLGIQNISGEVLKYFISDLKKLIKHELQNRSKHSSAQDIESQWSERLHSASTFSSRVRSRAPASTICSKDCQKPRKDIPRLFNSYPHSAPNVRQCSADVQPPRRACSCVRVEKTQEVKDKKNKENIEVVSNNNLIKVPKQPVKKKCDPVSLYHYYTSLWAKYKDNVPGENDWSDLRWQVRQKMAGSLPKQGSKMPLNQRRTEENS